MKSGTRGETKRRKRGVPGAGRPHDAQRTNGAADCGHMSINPLRPLNASLPFHYPSPFGRPRSPPPRHFSLPICIAHLDTPVTNSCLGGGASPPRAFLYPLPFLYWFPFPLRGLMNSSAASWPQPAAQLPAALHQNVAR